MLKRGLEEIYDGEELSTPDFKKRVVADQTSLQYELDQDEEERSEYIEYIRAFACTETRLATVVELVSNFNENHFSNTEYKSLLTNTLIKFSENRDCFDVSTIELTNIEEVSACLLRFNKYLKLENVNELALQSACFFLLSSAMIFCDTNSLKMRLNGGGKYDLKDITAISEKFGERSSYFNSDWDFSLCDEEILKRLQPFKVVPYFGVYEIQKKPLKPQTQNSDLRTETICIEDHIDFCKMACVLRSMIKSYSSLKMAAEDLRKITVWGVLQSSTQIWFLKCNAEPMTLPDTSFAIIYNVVHSRQLSVVTDCFEVCKLFCKMMEDGANLTTVLKQFKPLLESTYQSKFSHATFDLENIKNMNFLLASLQFFGYHEIEQVNKANNKELDPKLKHRMDYYFSLKGFAYSTPSKIIPCEQITNYTDNFSDMYLYKTDAIFYYKKGHIVNSHKAIVILKILDEQEYFLLGYSKFDESQTQATKTSNLIRNIEGCTDNINKRVHGSTHTFLNDENSNFDTIAERVSDKENMVYIDTSVVKDTKDQLKFALNWYRRSFATHTVALREYISDRNIYCEFFRHNRASPNFLKLAHANTTSEAISIMRRLENQELSHKNINKIVKYTILYKQFRLVEQYSEFVTITECEHLDSLASVMRELPFTTVSSVLHWISNNVILNSLSGLYYLHNNGIIHGDLSFGNILFKKDELIKNYFAVLCDFNDCFLMKETKKIKYRQYSFGKDDYLTNADCFASVECDYFAWMICICKIIYYILFRTRDDSKISEGHRSLEIIFETTSWYRFTNDAPLTLSQILDDWKQMFKKIVVTKKQVTGEHLLYTFKKVTISNSKLCSNIANKENLDPMVS